MAREKQRGNPRSVPDYDRVFYSYDARCPDTLRGVAAKIRDLHFAVNSVEEQYEQALAEFTGLNTGILPKPVADDFKVLHKRTEIVLHQLADFFKIPVDGIIGASADSKHRYHEMVIRAFRYKDNPLTPILGCRNVQDTLFAWKKWRNKWGARESGEEIESVDEGNTAFIKIPDLIRKLREAISEANSIARHGTQVIRGERGEQQIDGLQQNKKAKKRDSVRSKRGSTSSLPQRQRREN